MKGKIQVIQLTTATMFATVGVILGNFSIILPVFSVPALRLDIVAIPIILAGLILGKWYGMGVGIIIDLVNFLLYGQGAYHIGFTINNALIGLFSGMIPMFFQHKNFLFIKRTLLISSSVLIVLTIGILFLYSSDRLSLGGDSFPLTMEVRIAIIALMIVMSGLTIGFMYLTLRDYKYELKDMYTVSLMIILIEFFVIILLTPLWIQDLFGQPYIIGFLARIIRGALMIPFKIIIVLAIINVIKKQQVTTLRGFIEN